MGGPGRGSTFRGVLGKSVQSVKSITPIILPSGDDVAATLHTRQRTSGALTAAVPCKDMKGSATRNNLRKSLGGYKPCEHYMPLQATRAQSKKSQEQVQHQNAKSSQHRATLHAELHTMAAGTIGCYGSMNRRKNGMIHASSSPK